MGGFQLKPCPFCGNTEDLRFSSVGSMLADMPDRPYRVVCLGENCEEVSGPLDYGKRKAAAAWNSRADLVAGQPHSAELAEAMALIKSVTKDTEWDGSDFGENNKATEVDAAIATILNAVVRGELK